jgi:hypothetical protein
MLASLISESLILALVLAPFELELGLFFLWKTLKKNHFYQYLCKKRGIMNQKDKQISDAVKQI